MCYCVRHGVGRVQVQTDQASRMLRTNELTHVDIRGLHLPPTYGVNGIHVELAPATALDTYIGLMCHVYYFHSEIYIDYKHNPHIVKKWYRCNISLGCLPVMHSHTFMTDTRRDSNQPRHTYSASHQDCTH